MKVSICGLGVMGKNHLRISQKLNLELNSTYDLDNGDDYERFLESLKLSDALIIASPTKTHTRVILDAKKYNSQLKILCEKPVSFSSEEQNIEKILQYNDSVLIGQIERFNPVCQKMFVLAKKEQIISVKTSRVNNVPAREKIDCRKDIGIHDVDFCCALMNKKPKDIFIFNNQEKTHENLFYKIDETIVTNEVSWNYPYKNRTFEILTKNGVYKGNFYNQILSFFDWTGEEKQIEIEKREPLENEILFLKQMVEKNVLPKVTIEDNLEILKLMGY